MRIIAADDEQLMLEMLVDKICQVQPGADICAFRSPSKLLAALEEDHAYDVAFLDIEMPGMTGLELAARIKTFAPDINIVFVTGFSQYKGDAMDLRASGYLMKPVTADGIRTELDNLRHPVEKPQNKRMRVQTFGSFEVFVDGAIMKFGRSRTKELFAYLIDRRGASCSAGELMGILWEEQEESLSLRSNLRNLIADLTTTLHTLDLDNVIVKGRNQIAVVPEEIDCDYYDFLQGDIRAVNAFRGEYMNNYSWSELTTGGLAQFD